MNEKIIKHKNTNSNIISKDNNLANDLINTLEQAEKIAEYVANSKVYGKQFENKVPILDDNGEPKLDEDGNKITQIVINKADVIACIMLGQELGIPPLTAITLGRKLNINGFTKIKRGEKLGLDPITALDVIDVIPTSNGDIISIGVHIATAKLLEHNIKIEILKDFQPHNIYIAVSDKKEVSLESLEANKEVEPYGIINNSTPPAKIAEFKKNNTKLIILMTTKITTVRLTRDRGTESEQVITKSMTLFEATESGLYNGTKLDGTKVTGKNNWNNAPNAMLTNRPLLRAARIIASDLLFNTYSKDEVSEFTSYENVDVEDAREVIDQK